MQAYPDAKVTLNTRADLDAWFQSVDDTFGDMSRSWIFYIAHFFNSALFWIFHVMTYGFLGLDFRGDWQCNGKEVYWEHVARIRSLNLPVGKLLEWSVEQG